MARRTKTADLAGMSAGGLLTYGIFHQLLPNYSWVLIGFSVLTIWICFFMNKYCDVVPQGKKKPCGINVYGKLRGCRYHGREKRDALFALMNMRNPGVLFRLAWNAPPFTTVQAPDGFGPRVSRRNAYDVCMLRFTILGSLGSVISIIINI